MTSSRYIFDPQPGTNNFHDILSALVAVFPPLYSLDIIPERLRYMFREETGVTLVATDGGTHKKTDFTFTTIKSAPVPTPADNPVPHFKVSVHPDAVKADDLGWIDTFKSAPPEDDTILRDLEAAMWANAGSVRGMAIGALERIRAGNVAGLTTTDLRDKIVCKAAKDRDAALAGMVKAEDEVERLRAELNRCVGPLVPKEKLDAAIARADEHLKARSMLAKACEEAVSQRDAFKAEVEQRIRERDHYAEQSNRWISDVKQLKAEVAALRLKCGEF